MLPETFRCYLVEKDESGKVSARITRRRLAELPPGDVLLRVDYSSLNYKDALAATGHPGVNRVFPHIPGVDAAGEVAGTGVYEFVEGDQVLVTGFDMGSNRAGGWAEYVRVPQDWVVPMPRGLTTRQSMMIGTGGLTAAFCVDALRRHDVAADAGEVVVSGASGGVGSFAVALLARLGYQVVAVTGKTSAHDYLRLLGAAEVVGRETLTGAGDKPLLSGRWAGAIDTVGGAALSAILRATRRGGCVASCGNAGGFEIPGLTVYPFILRGVTLAGIDAAWCPIALRHQTWDRLAGPWKLDDEHLQRMARFVTLEELPGQIEAILAGRITGRVVVRIGAQE